MQRDAATEAVFKPVRPPTTFEETVERLGTAIRLGLLPAGSRLPAERDLAGQLGEAVELAGLGPLGRQDRGAGLDGDPVVEHRPGGSAKWLSLLLRQRRPLGDERATGAPPLGDEMTALHKSGESLAKRRT